MGSFKHLSKFERGKIELMWKQGHKQAEQFKPCFYLASTYGTLLSSLDAEDA